MINPLTFNTTNYEKHLTWSQDDAVVNDAIFSARTKSNPLAIVNNETNGRGSNPLYVVDFQAVVDSKDKNKEHRRLITINVMRGYIAGRYFEVSDQTLTVVDPTRDAIQSFVLHIVANAYSQKDMSVVVDVCATRDDVTLFNKIGQIGQAENYLSVNNNTREKNRLTDINKIHSFAYCFIDDSDVFISSDVTDGFNYQSNDNNPYAKAHNDTVIEMISKYTKKEQYGTNNYAKGISATTNTEAEALTVGDSKSGLLTITHTRFNNQLEPDLFFKQTHSTAKDIASKYQLPKSGWFVKSNGQLNVLKDDLIFAPYITIADSSITIPDDSNVTIQDAMSKLSGIINWTDTIREKVKNKTSISYDESYLSMFTLNLIDEADNLSQTMGISTFDVIENTNTKKATSNFLSYENIYKLKKQDIRRVVASVEYSPSFHKLSNWQTSVTSVDFIKAADADQNGYWYLWNRSYSGNSSDVVLKVSVYCAPKVGKYEVLQATLNTEATGFTGSDSFTSETPVELHQSPESSIVTIYVPLPTISFLNKGDTMTDWSVPMSKELFLQKLQRHGRSLNEALADFLKIPAIVMVERMIRNENLEQLLMVSHAAAINTAKKLDIEASTLTLSTKKGINQKKGFLQ